MWRRIRIACFSLLLTCVFGMVAMAAPERETLAQLDQRCFDQTGYCIAGRIREFWEQNGGLPVFGYPTGRQQEELIEGQPFQVQWFERNRLELHPEKARPYDVLLGRLGADRLGQQGLDWMQFPPSQSRAGCRFFPETGHNACGAILAAWRANGLEFDGQRGKSEAENLALYGLPLSDERVEVIEGKEYTVQWFERARFELHPENAPPFHVLLGLLGNEVRQAVPGAPASAPPAQGTTPTATRTPMPTRTPTPTNTPTRPDLGGGAPPPDLVSEAGGFGFNAPLCLQDDQLVEVAQNWRFCPTEDAGFSQEEDAQITVTGPDGTIIEEAVLEGSPSNLSYGSWFWFGRQGYAAGPYTLTAEQNDKTLVRTVQLQPATSARIVVGLPIGTSTRGASDLLRDVSPGTTLDIILAGFSPVTSVPLYIYSEGVCETPPLSTTQMCFLTQLPRDSAGVVTDERGEATYKLKTQSGDRPGYYCVTARQDGTCDLQAAFQLASQ
jgi:hypothetical protein